jgi:hypothetical protein
LCGQFVTLVFVFQSEGQDSFFYGIIYIYFIQASLVSVDNQTNQIMKPLLLSFKAYGVVARAAFFRIFHVLHHLGAFLL